MSAIMFIEMMTRPGRALKSGRVRFLLSTNGVIYDPAKLADLLLKKAGLTPIGTVTGDGKHAQVVLSISELTGDAGNMVIELHSMLNKASKTLSDEEWKSVCHDGQSGVSQFVQTAYSNHSEVFEGKVLDIFMDWDCRRVVIELVDGRKVWAELSNEHRDSHQDPPLWIMLQQVPDAIYRIPRHGDRIKVAEIVDLPDHRWRGASRALCWLLPFASA